MKEPNPDAPTGSPKPDDRPCGRIFIDGVDYGFFSRPCREVEVLLSKVLGRKVKIPPSPPGAPPLIEPRTGDVLRLELVRESRKLEPPRSSNSPRKGSASKNRAC